MVVSINSIPPPSVPLVDVRSGIINEYWWDFFSALAGDAELKAISELTSAANTVPYFTGSGTAALAPFTGGAWTPWTPTISAFSGTLTSSVINRARYAQLGKTVIANVDVTITNAGTGAIALVVSLPVTAQGGFGAGSIMGREIAIVGYGLAGEIKTTTTVIVFNASTGGNTVITNHRHAMTIIYEAA